MSFRVAIPVLATACLLVPAASHASWPADDTTNVKTVDNFGCAVVSMRAVPDGMGGAIGAMSPVLCQNGRNGYEGGRVTADGLTPWPDGTFLTPGNAIYDWNGNCVLVPDGAGGAFSYWILSVGELRGRHTDASGAITWGSGEGQLLSTPLLLSQVHDAATDDAGGSIVVYAGFSGSTAYLLAQRLDASGTEMWTPGGVVFATNTSYDWIQVVPDGAHGVLVVWREGTTLRANRVAADGSLPWGPAGAQTPVAAASPTRATAPEATAATPHAVSDGAGGVIVAWSSTTVDAAGDLYAKRVDAAGGTPWIPATVPVAVGPGAITALRCAPDSSGGVIVTWTDDQTLIAQRIDSIGQLRWASNGVAVCAAPGAQTQPAIASDTQGGAFIAWTDARHGVTDIYVQRLDGAGQALWMADGEAMCTAAGPQTLPALVAATPDHAIALWVDGRDPELFGDFWNQFDIYAQRIPLSANVDVAPGRPPASVRLAGFAPNPAVGTPLVAFALPAAGEVQLELLDLAGRRLVQRNVFVPAGRQTIALPEASRLAPGAYWIRLRAGGEVVHRLGTLLR